ncbi:spermidine synthase [Thalassolituus sp. LLYu03]|uniref:spermidine synthase n=1 Tax=Thalassolituus sp. LLYu03 TaxID=3421656 RepID=UPI003D2C03A5
MDLSHLGRELHRRYDEFGPILVLDDGNKRYLSFGTADEQSCQLKSAPLQLQHEYARSMASVLVQFASLSQVQQVTLLGTGAGTMASTLHHVLADAHIDAVDVRAAVFQVAWQYFGLPRGPRLTTHTSDAGFYLRDAQPGHCDLLIADLYLADGLDPLVLQPDFLKACAGHLSDDGWLVLNLWKEHREQTDCLAHLKALFPLVLQTTTSDGNWILHASRAAAASKDGARERAKALAAPLGFNLWNSVKGFYRHR